MITATEAATVLHTQPAQERYGIDWRRASPWLLGFVIWTLLALLSSLQTVVSLWSVDRPVAWSFLLPRNLIDWYTCAIFTPAYFWMVRKWPLHRSRAMRILGIYAGLTAIIVVIKYAIQVPLINLLITDPERQWTLGATLADSFIRENVAFWCVLGVVLSLEYYNTLRERDVHEARLQTQLTAARLDALAAQMQPHFLFNTIQGISTLIHRDPNAADAMLARLSTLLRHTLQQDEGHEVRLSAELELLDLYLGIMRERFGDRLTVTIDVTEEAGDACVPRFLLQPLVENALHHGIARHAGPGVVAITGARDGDSLVVTVTDDSPARTHSIRAPASGGIGLGNTRSRLEQLYGERQRLDAAPRPHGGFAVTVRIPWRVARPA